MYFSFALEIIQFDFDQIDFIRYCTHFTPHTNPAKYNRFIALGHVVLFLTNAIIKYRDPRRVQMHFVYHEYHVYVGLR